jgi:hypothetical protein
MLFKKKKIIQYNEFEMVHFYEQLVKMKKNRPHINPVEMVRKSYPNSHKDILEIIKLQ